MDMLRRLGEALFEGLDPSALFYRGRAHDVRRQGEGYRLDLVLPFTSKEEVSAKRLGDELLLQVGTYRRTLVLPRALSELEITSAAMQDGMLRITFGGRQNGIS